MALSAFTKFHCFSADLAHGVHNLSSDATCTLTLALSNAANAPSASLDLVLADFTQIAYTNLSSRVVSIASSVQVGGVWSLVLNDLTLLASGGSVAPFRYVSLYNDDPTSPADPLIGFYDYGVDVTLGDGEDILVDFAALGALTLT